jgi:hypothetical protein
MPNGYDEYLAWEQEYGYGDQMSTLIPTKRVKFAPCGLWARQKTAAPYR